MATLFNTKISDTYEGLIKTSDNGVIGAVEKNLTDGLGNASTFSIGTSTASFTGTLDLTNATVLGLSTGAVDSVNGLTGVVVLTTTNIAEGTNLYFTDARVAANSAVTLNTAKVGITTTQADAIVLNTAKVGITIAQANEISVNTLKVGITTQQSTDITNNNAKISFDSASSTKLNGIEAGAQVNTVDSVNSLTGAVSLGLLELDDVGSDGSNGQVLTTNGSGSFTFTTVSAGGAVDSVNGATGVVVLDTDDIAEGTTNKYMVLGTTATTALAGNTSLLQLGTTSTTALAGNTTTITSQQASDITANNAKVGITTTQANEIAANTLKVGITTQQATDITNNNAKISFTSTGTNNYLSKWNSNTLIDSIIFDNGTNVGIGTTNPIEKLQINSGDILINNGTLSTIKSAGSLYLDLNTFGTYSGRNFRISNNGTTLVNVKQTGEVGIGTDSPSYKLEVDGTSRITGRLTLGGNVNNYIEGSAGSVDFKSNGQFYFTKGSDNLLTVLETGNVGIGTTTPADKLSVVSTVGILGDNTNQGLLKLYCEASSHYVGIKGGVHSGGSTYTLQLPNALPSVANQILETNATGTTSWINTPINTIDSIVSGEPTGSDQVINVVSLTQAEYDAGTPVATTFYIIT